MAGQGYGAVPPSAPVPSSNGLRPMRSAMVLVSAVLGVAAVLLVVTYASLPGPVVLEAAPARGLSQLDKQIKTDEALLKAQQSVVDKAESLLVKALNKKPAMTKGSRVYGDARRSGTQTLSKAATQHLMVDPKLGGEERPFSADWHEGDPGKWYEIERAVQLNGPPDTDVIDGEKMQEWNDFFDGLSKKVDAPRWDKTGLLSDDIEAIPPCSVDCDKWGTEDDKDFAFYDMLLTTNDRGHIIDNLKDITACLIDC